jgi:hypothetical protein
MGYRINETYHRTEEEAVVAQRNSIGIRVTSETYGKGVFPCRMVNRDTGEKYDGFKSVTETYYG